MNARTRTSLTEGLVAGLLGYLAVALFFAAVNVLGGAPPLETVSHLGAVLTGASVEPGTVDLPSVLAYNGLHLFVSLVVGFLAAWIFMEMELHPGLWYVAFFVLMSALIYSLVVMGVFGSEILGVIAWEEVVAGNLVWAGTILGSLAWRHRSLGGRLVDPEE